MTDFDQTLTRYNYLSADKKADSSFKALQSAPNFTQESRDKFKSMFEFYKPIEMDIELTAEQKIPHMQRWWEVCMNLVTSVNIKKSDYASIVIDSKLLLRDGISEML